MKLILKAIDNPSQRICDACLEYKIKLNTKSYLTIGVRPLFDVEYYCLDSLIQQLVGEDDDDKIDVMRDLIYVHRLGKFDIFDDEDVPAIRDIYDRYIDSLKIVMINYRAFPVLVDSETGERFKLQRVVMERINGIMDIVCDFNNYMSTLSSDQVIENRSYINKYIDLGLKRKTILFAQNVIHSLNGLFMFNEMGFEFRGKWYNLVGPWESQKGDCPICLENETSCYVSRCGHRFCENCIKTWMKNVESCPICRISLVENNELVRQFVRDNDKVIVICDIGYKSLTMRFNYDDGWFVNYYSLNGIRYRQKIDKATKRKYGNVGVRDNDRNKVSALLVLLISGTVFVGSDYILKSLGDLSYLSSLFDVEKRVKENYGVFQNSFRYIRNVNLLTRFRIIYQTMPKVKLISAVLFGLGSESDKLNVRTVVQIRNKMIFPKSPIVQYLFYKKTSKVHRMRFENVDCYKHGKKCGFIVEPVKKNEIDMDPIHRCTDDFESSPLMWVSIYAEIVGKYYVSGKKVQRYKEFDFQQFSKYMTSASNREEGIEVYWFSFPSLSGEELEIPNLGQGDRVIFETVCSFVIKNFKIEDGRVVRVDDHDKGNHLVEADNYQNLIKTWQLKFLSQ